MWTTTLTASVLAYKFTKTDRLISNALTFKFSIPGGKEKKYILKQNYFPIGIHNGSLRKFTRLSINTALYCRICHYHVLNNNSQDL